MEETIDYFSLNGAALNVQIKPSRDRKVLSSNISYVQRGQKSKLNETSRTTDAEAQLFSCFS